MTTRPRPRVLLIAEAANPEWVSVPLVGWSLVNALRQEADVHIVTQIRNRDAFVRAGLIEGQDFTAIDTERVARPFWKLAQILRMGEGKGWTMVTALQSLIYFYFERLLWQRFGADIKVGAFDIVHRVTPLSLTATSRVASKCARAGVPFVIGPLNGGLPWPKGFGAVRRREREWLSYIRKIYRLQPSWRRMLRASTVIITGSRHTATEVPAAFHNKRAYIPENAIDPSRFGRIAQQEGQGPLRACFIGRLVPYKGPDMVLEAAQDMLKSGQLQLDIIGDGPMRSDLEAQAKLLGVGGSVTFHGNLPHEQVQDVAVQSNLFVFPSVREFGGGVVIEAMALGLVPVIVDYGGPGELVDDSCSYKVAMGSRAEVVARLRAQLIAIVEDPSDLPDKAQAARQVVRNSLTWVQKARQVRSLYDWVLSDRIQPVPQVFELSLSHDARLHDVHGSGKIEP